MKAIEEHHRVLVLPVWKLTKFVTGYFVFEHKKNIQVMTDPVFGLRASLVWEQL